ncbi:DUF4436 domain-containing protein [Mycobacterium tilburgii]|uniref:DUF4436 domain-containing protein n=1 Tax=Mycobacterium tilburgii TaxID=44467 RepID=UPI0021B1D10C
MYDKNFRCADHRRGRANVPGQRSRRPAISRLFGVHYLQRSEEPLPPLDLSQGGGNDTIVQLLPDDLKTTAHSSRSMSWFIPRIRCTTSDSTYSIPTSRFACTSPVPGGEGPAQLDTAIEAHGDPANWPFYT